MSAIDKHRKSHNFLTILSHSCTSAVVENASQKFFEYVRTHVNGFMYFVYPYFYLKVGPILAYVFLFPVPRFCQNTSSHSVSVAHVFFSFFFPMFLKDEYQLWNLCY